MWLFASCSARWDDESQESFKQACLETAKDQGFAEQQAVSMCRCRLEVAMRKYPQLSNALEHANDIASDPEIKACR